MILALEAKTLGRIHAKVPGLTVCSVEHYTEAGLTACHSLSQRRDPCLLREQRPELTD